MLTSAFGLGHKILLPQFTTFTGNNDLFLSALRASRNKRIIFCFKSFISSLDHYDLRIIIIFRLVCKIDLIHSANMTGSVQDDELITPTERTHKLGTCLGMPTGSQKATSSALGDRLILTPPQKYDSVLS